MLRLALSTLCVLVALSAIATATAVLANNDEAAPVADAVAEHNGKNNNNDAAAGANGLVAGRLRPAKRSIFQACRKDIETLCMNGNNKNKDDGDKKKDEQQQQRRKALRNAAQCLEDNKDDVKEESCKAWLGARDVCFKDAATACPALVSGEDKEALKGKAKNAGDRGRKMMCLRQAAPEKFSEECRESDFFKAIVGMRRFHRALNKKAGGAKGEEVKKIAKKMSEA